MVSEPKMREILFRGKDADNSEWVYGWYTEYPYGRYPLKPTIIPKEEANGGYYTHTQVIPETVGQFTGKTHKSGVKIFDGDIAEFTNKDGSKARYVIEWNDVFAAWTAKWTAGEGHMYVTALVCEYMEIIGNIHDNPELLEVSHA